MVRFGTVCTLIAMVASLGVASGCGGKSRSTGGGGGGDEGASDAGTTRPPDPVRKVLDIALEYVVIDPDAEPPLSRVALIFTDETGASRRELIGEFPGGCSDVSATARGEAMKPILGLDCWNGDRGVQLRFAHRKDKLYVISAQVEKGSEPEYQPLKTIDLPQGTPVRTSADS